MRFLPGTSTDSTISHGPFFPDRRVQRDGRCVRFKRFLWNPELRTVCNRTGKNWGKLIVNGFTGYVNCWLWFLVVLFVVYAIFMGILIGMFVLSLQITMWSLRKFYGNSPLINRADVIKGAAPGNQVYKTKRL